MAYTVTLDSDNALVSLEQTKHFLGIEVGDPQILDVTCKSETEDNLGGKYFTFATTLQEYYAWFDVGNASSDPSVADTTAIEVDISNLATAEAVATALASAITSLSDVSATADENTVTITNGSDGEVTAPDIGTTSFDIRVQQKGGTGDEEQDEILTSAINEVSEWFNTVCNRDLASRAQTEFYDGESDYILWLLNPPVASLTLYVDSERAFGSSTEITSADYEMDADTGRVELTGASFVSAFRTTKATYTGGFSTVPYDLVRAVLIKIEIETKLASSKAYAVQTRSDGAGGVTGYKETTMLVDRIIAKYGRRVMV
jgi:hypothetical protein